MPGQLRVASPLVDGQHDQEHIGKDGRSIDAEGNRGHVSSVGSQRQTVRLPCVEKISAKNRQRHSWQDAAGHEFHGKAAERRQSGDKQQIGEAAKEQPEETVQIARDEPSPRLG